MFIAMNRFMVNDGKGEAFEERWRTRQTYLNEVPGFVHFSLLKGDTAGEYISHSMWESREAFVAWTQSESFAAGHRQGSMEGMLAGPPQVSLYEAVIEEGAKIGATA
jgi:heme-degrading monooxygenase HmoA